jgi:MATE family multidrug resistance protein
MTDHAALRGPVPEHGLGELLRLSLPMVVSVVSYNAMTLADTLFVGRLGASPLAGVALASTAGFVMMFFAAGVLSAAKTLVAQSIGAGRADEATVYVGAAVATALGLGILTVAVGQALAELLPWLSATPVAGQAARTYLKIRSAGAPMALLATALREARYGEGDSLSPTAAAVIANLANIALAYVFVWRCGWGVLGAAVATLFAQSLDAGMLAVLAGVQRGRVLALRLVRRRHLRALWCIGLPAGLQFLVEVGAFVVLTSLVAAMSAVQVAAHQVALQIMQFAILPAFGFAEAAAVLAARAVGAGRDDRVVRIARASLVAISAYTVLCSAVFASAGAWIISQFTSDPALASVALRLLYVAAILQVINGANIVARATLRGCGDVRFAAWVGAVASWAFTPPIAWAVGYRMGLGAFGGWLGIGCESVVATCLLWWRLARGGWKPAAAESRARLAAPAPGAAVPGPIAACAES